MNNNASVIVCLILLLLGAAVSDGYGEKVDPDMSEADGESQSAGTQLSIDYTYLARNGSATVDSNATGAETVYFMSVLFEKYSSSKLKLSLDGFTQLLCSLGLLHTSAETFEADDESRDLNIVCKTLTYSAFRAQHRVFHSTHADHPEDHRHHEDGHAHADCHSDHDRHLNPDLVGQPADSAVPSDVSAYQSTDTTGKTGSTTSHDHATSRRERAVNVFKAVERRSVPSDVNRRHARGSAVSLGHYLDQTECLDPLHLFDTLHIPTNGSMHYWNFLNICPALIYVLDKRTCQHSSHEDTHNHTHSSETPISHSFQSIPGRVWGLSTLAVLIISLVGLLGVAVIPIMQKVFYNHLLQLLVALAVGALSGDALLHLLPHALAADMDQKHTHEEPEGKDHHLASVWKGLTALLCIFFFFLVERILTIVTEKKRRRKAMHRLKKKRCEQLCDIEKSSAVGAKLSSHDADDHLNCEQMVMVVHPNRSLKGYADATHDVLLHQCDESLSQPEGHFEEDMNDSSHASLGHSHGGHTHAHSVPGSVAAVAWMVILGDGIHNLSDGLAIGAAFASSVAGGISTSIAVFCHELPHEIGDFAVLLRAGMSVKQAIVYNCVSSLLCIIGMVIGVAIGNIHSASIWIFAGVAGMFLYISMVDMLPEMTAVDTKKGEPQFLHLFLQVCGICVGAGIMLLIAVYEHRLQRLLD